MEPKEKLRKARRLVAVQAALERRAAWALIDLEQQDLALRQQQEKVVRFLDSETALDGVFSAALLRRLQALADRRAALNAEREMCAARRSEERLRLRCAERVVATLGHETRRIDAARELESVIDSAQQAARVRPEQG